jgi:hypothetical protein
MQRERINYDADGTLYYCITMNPGMRNYHSKSAKIPPESKLGALGPRACGFHFAGIPLSSFDVRSSKSSKESASTGYPACHHDGLLSRRFSMLSLPRWRRHIIDVDQSNRC